MNCLAVKLNSVIENTDYEYLKEIRFEIPSNITTSINMPEKAILKALSGNFRIEQDGETKTAYTFPDNVETNQAKVYAGSEDCVLCVISEYNAKWNASIGNVTILSDPYKIFLRRINSFSADRTKCAYDLDVSKIDVNTLVYTFRVRYTDWVVGNIANLARCWDVTVLAANHTIHLTPRMTGTIEEFANTFIETFPETAYTFKFYNPERNTDVTYNGNTIETGLLTINADGTFSYSPE